MKVTSLIWTVYTVRKQETDNSGQVRNNVADTTIVTINEKRREFSDIKKHFGTPCDMYGFKFLATPVAKDMRGTFQANLCLIYNFKY